MKTITLICLAMAIVSCGIFRKNRETHRQSIEREVLELERNQKDIETRSDNVHRNILDITVRTYGNKKDVVITPENAEEYESLHDDILKEIIIHSETTGKNSSEGSDKSLTEKSASEKEGRKKKADSLLKDSDTSLLANVPAFVWWIVIPVLLLFLYLALKKWQVL